MGNRFLSTYACIILSHHNIIIRESVNGELTIYTYLHRVRVPTLVGRVMQKKYVDS